MDASQITKLREKQYNRHIHRPQTVDSSTLTWKQQIQSSTYIRPSLTTVASCCQDESGQRQYGGQGKQTTLSTGSTQQYPNVLASATGSASEVYSSERILLQKAGKQSCGNSCGVLSCPIDLPACYCENTNAPQLPDVPNPQNNPYLPRFDTYYRFKHPQCDDMQDKNQKHFVLQCPSDGCVITPSE